MSVLLQMRLKDRKRTSNTPAHPAHLPVGRMRREMAFKRARRTSTALLDVGAFRALHFFQDLRRQIVYIPRLASSLFRAIAAGVPACTTMTYRRFCALDIPYLLGTGPSDIHIV